MTIQEEIEKLKKKLGEVKDEGEEGEVLLELLDKYSRISGVNNQQYIDRLLQLSDTLNLKHYKAWGLFYLTMQKRVKSEYDDALVIAQQALLIFEELNEKSGVADTYHHIGNIFSGKGKHQEALTYNMLALKIREEIADRSGIAVSYNQIGINHQELGNYPEALKFFLSSLKISDALSNKRAMASTYMNIGRIFEQQDNYSEAVKNQLLAFNLFKELGHKLNMAGSLSNLGNVYRMQGNFTKALESHYEALRISEEINYKNGIAGIHGNIGNTLKDLGKHKEALGHLLISSEIIKELVDRFHLATCYTNIGDIYLTFRDFIKAGEYFHTAIDLGLETGNKEVLKVSYLALANTYKAMSDFERAFNYHEKYHSVETELLGAQSQKQLNELNFQHNMEQKEKDLEIAHLRNVELKKERDRSEALLLNILPAEVAEELKEKGSADAKLFDEVTVLFTDFKGFTNVSEQLTPQELVNELNECFKVFDEIIGRYNIEKIKTVGDAYLAAAGLPSPNQSHADDMIRAALEIRDFMVSRKKKLGKRTFEMRVGIHSGSVVAGIVGVKKFAYDIWGDTVNTAARMEQHGVPGKVNISHTTYELVKDKFRCEYRGELEAKNKGKLKMYFVE